MGAPLDLEQFGPTLANPDAAALLEECRHQREEIARLRRALETVARMTPYYGGDDVPSDPGDAQDALNGLILRARAALAGEGAA